MINNKNTKSNRLQKAIKFIGSVPSIMLHTIFFLCIGSLYFFHININTVLLTLTTMLSLEAVYLSLFIQYSINKNTEELSIIEDELDIIESDIEHIQKR